jgi:glycosyltransferase involved in cell wall biosynthesis
MTLIRSTSLSRHPAPLRVCIVAHNAFGALAGATGPSIGGVERQTTLLARWLSERGHQVSLVTWCQGQADGTTIDNIIVRTLCPRDAGLPIVRFLYPRWTSLNAALSRADADVYYHNGAEYVTGQVAWWVRRHGRRLVFSSASDHDCSAALPLLKTLRERVLYRYGLRRADRIVVQTSHQQMLLSEGFGLSSVVLPMPCPEPEHFTPPRPPALDNTTRRILWLGRITAEKRPDRFLDLVMRCPALSFELAGPADDSAYVSQLLARAMRLPNLRVAGPVSREHVPALLRRAACLCSTSDHEGFPNTFIEAWSQAIPVVSTFDPDGLIGRHGLGAVARDVPSLATALGDLLASPALWNQASQSARRYYLATHTPERAMPGFEQVFLGLVHGESSTDSTLSAEKQFVLGSGSSH